VHVSGSTFTVVGDFRPVAIRRDIQKRGGVAINELTDKTNYVIVSGPADSDNQIVKEAADLGIPCISIDEYRDQVPDDLESE